MTGPALVAAGRLIEAAGLGGRVLVEADLTGRITLTVPSAVADEAARRELVDRIASMLGAVPEQTWMHYSAVGRTAGAGHEVWVVTPVAPEHSSVPAMWRSAS